MKLQAGLLQMQPLQYLVIVFGSVHKSQWFAGWRFPFCTALRYRSTNAAMHSHGIREGLGGLQGAPCMDKGGALMGDWCWCAGKAAGCKPTRVQGLQLQVF
jgi:hypothetical protein